MFLSGVSFLFVLMHVCKLQIHGCITLSVYVNLLKIDIVPQDHQHHHHNHHYYHHHFLHHHHHFPTYHRYLYHSFWRLMDASICTYLWFINKVLILICIFMNICSALIQQAGINLNNNSNNNKIAVHGNELHYTTQRECLTLSTKIALVNQDSKVLCCHNTREQIFKLREEPPVIQATNSLYISLKNALYAVCYDDDDDDDDDISCHACNDYNDYA
uniref:Uncharacterized protein n=1 Tax=Glossina brevipalpis TaxID=37001 RepID=A0A1A9WIW6_9MUSC